MTPLMMTKHGDESEIRTIDSLARSDSGTPTPFVLRYDEQEHKIVYEKSEYMKRSFDGSVYELMAYVCTMELASTMRTYWSWLTELWKLI